MPADRLKKQEQKSNENKRNGEAGEKKTPPQLSKRDDESL
jgi:hypothetical protein